jgi:hypothetical protein
VCSNFRCTLNRIERFGFYIDQNPVRFSRRITAETNMYQLFDSVLQCVSRRGSFCCGCVGYPQPQKFLSPQSVVPRSFSRYTCKFAYQATRLLSLLEAVEVVEFDSQVYLVGESRLRFRWFFPLCLPIFCFLLCASHALGLAKQGCLSELFVLLGL